MNRMKAQDIPATVSSTKAQGHFQSALELFVPQTVDQGVDDWGEDSVNSRDELVGAPESMAWGRTYT